MARSADYSMSRWNKLKDWEDVKGEKLMARPSGSRFFGWFFILFSSVFVGIGVCMLVDGLRFPARPTAAGAPTPVYHRDGDSGPGQGDRNNAQLGQYQRPSSLDDLGRVQG